MNAAAAHARAHGGAKTPVFSPWHVHIVDRDPHGNRGFNTYPFDTGRHVGVRTPADNELILVQLAAPLP